MDTENTQSETTLQKNSEEQTMSQEQTTLQTPQEQQKQLTPEQQQKLQKRMEFLIDNSMKYADNVVKHLVSHTLNKKIDDVFQTYVKTIGEIHVKYVDNKENKLTYSLSLSIVPKDYMLDLMHFTGNREVLKLMGFLIDLTKLAYRPIKEYMKKWSSDNNVEFNYEFIQVAHNTTLYLDENSQKRIGFILKKVTQ